MLELIKAIAVLALVVLGLGLWSEAPIIGSRIWGIALTQQSFAECYLEQMRGEPADLSPFAIAICQKRTGESMVESLAKAFPTRQEWPGTPETPTARP